MHSTRNSRHSTGARSTTRSLLSGQFWGELRVFLAVAKTKSFNRAAEITNTSQPTVSRQVKRLQDVVGSQLFISTARGVKLTQKGEALAHALCRLDHTLYSITSDLKAETSEAEGIVSVSITDGLNALFAAPAARAIFRAVSKNSTASEEPDQSHEPAGKPDRHDDRVSARPSRPTSGFESSGSFISFLSSRRTTSGSTACRRAIIWNSMSSCSRNTTSPRPGCGMAGSRPWRADALRITATIPSPTACWSRPGRELDCLAATRWWSRASCRWKST